MFNSGGFGESLCEEIQAFACIRRTCSGTLCVILHDTGCRDVIVNKPLAEPSEFTGEGHTLMGCRGWVEVEKTANCQRSSANGLFCSH